MSSINNILEAKYLSIKWADKESALSIKESKDSLPVEVLGNTKFSIEATTFSKLDSTQFGQLGFRVINENIKIPLYILKPNREKVYLKPVLDLATKKTWWVEGEIWSKSNKRWQSEIFRSAGVVYLSIGNYKCKIKIGSSSFSYEQFSNYLKDFKNDLWYLALHETSYISAPVKEKSFDILDESSITYFNHFIEFADNILKKPKSELREIQELKNIKQVKPTPRTFMEIATRGYTKKLTSRSSKATYNVPENQYVLYVVNRIFKLLNNLGKVSNYITTSLQDKIKTQKERINSFSDTIKINRKAVVNDYKELGSKIKEERDIIASTLKNQNKNYIQSNLYEKTYSLIELGNPPEKKTDNKLTFFLQSGLKDLGENKWYLFKFKDEWNDIIKKGETYNISGKFTYKIVKYGHDKELHILDFNYIESLEVKNSIHEEKYKKLKQLGINLGKNNWKRKITPVEKKEQEEEKLSIKSLIDKASLESKNIKKLSIKLKPALNKLKVIRKNLTDLKIKADSLFPNSMSFIQNPNYQGVHKLYKEIQSLSGIDERVFKGLEDAEEIGILNISLIYERWCFLQIIKVLIDKFNFKPEKDWKNKLLNQIVNIEPNKVRNVELHFENKKTNRKIVLWYEKELPIDEGRIAPRRADFVIELKSNFNENEPSSKKLVLDAKFYENINDMGGISKVIDELYNLKNYSESSKNHVFILHPSLDSVPNIKTPQEWSENSYLGETQQFEWDDDFPNHRYGALLLSPIQNKGRYLDSLQICIGMFLQYGIENNTLEETEYNEWTESNLRKASGFNPIPGEKQFCLLCGSDECSEKVSSTYYGLKWETNCKKCRHKTYYNYCINKKCRNRLIKHGPYWTYHATQSMQPYNIKCPSCGEITVDTDSEK